MLLQLTTVYCIIVPIFARLILMCSECFVILVPIVSCAISCKRLLIYSVRMELSCDQ